jgi:pimeloyl-ACP methyl ester carboxylesterase
MRRRISRRIVGALVGAAATLTPATAVAQVATPAPCSPDAGSDAVCGTVAVPLDRADPRHGTIAIAYELHRHTDRSRPSLGTIVTSIGGPGGSNIAARDLWLEQFGSLLDRRDLLLVDHRGIGRSEAINCPGLQHVRGDQAAAAAACGRSLGAAADRYGSGDVADDIDDVRAALSIDKLDYYGDSYGAVDVRAYALRHADHLRSVILDSPMVPGDNTFLREWARWAARVQVRVCRRSPSCSAAARRPAATLAWLTHHLRAHPFSGVGRDADGRRHRVHVNETTVLGVLYNDNFGPFPFLNQGELTAAAQALRHGDRVPLLRLVAESPAPTDFGDPAGSTSVGAGYAVYCTDSTFVWDKRASVATRRHQYASALAALPTRATAPFAPAAWATFVKQQPITIEPAGDACISWPAPQRPNPPFPLHARFPNIPALVLNSELDLIPLRQAKALTRLFPEVTFVKVANAHHVTGWWNPCAAAIERRFIATLAAGNTSCAANPRAPFHAPGAPVTRFVPFHGVRSFPRLAADAPPARVAGRSVDRSTRAERRVATAAWSAVEDAVMRSMRMSGRTGRGLRGGSFKVRRFTHATTLRYHATRFTTDVLVTGRATLRTRTNRLRAAVKVAAPGGEDGRLRFAGVIFDPARPLVTIRGRLGGHRFSLQVLAN